MHTTDGISYRPPTVPKWAVADTELLIHSGAGKRVLPAINSAIRYTVVATKSQRCTALNVAAELPYGRKDKPNAITWQQSAQCAKTALIRFVGSQLL